jgi:hypothetical protein
MDDIEIGQIRKWRTDTNNEHFEIIEDNGVHHGNRFWIIQYTTDDRRQSKTDEEIFTKSVLCEE